MTPRFPPRANHSGTPTLTGITVAKGRERWVLSLPFALCYLLATRPEEVTRVLGTVIRVSGRRLPDSDQVEFNIGNGNQ